MQKDFYSSYFEVEKEHWLMKGRRAIVRDELYRAGLRPGARVLDFGCGSGITVSSLQDAGYAAEGVDFEEPVAYGMRRGIRGLIASDVRGRLPFEDRSFDAVTCMDVLEHLPDEQHALSEMRRVLKPGGVLLVMVPAYMWLWGQQDEVAHHYRRYTLGRVIEVVRQGLLMPIEKRSYFNTFLFPLVALVRGGSWILGLRARRESDFDLNNPVLNVIFGIVFSFERFFVRHLNLPFGVSILVVARNHG